MNTSLELLSCTILGFIFSTIATESGVVWANEAWGVGIFQDCSLGI
jgi:ABC-type transport system involved in cytochrome c biogenesis permease subunit